MTRIVYPVNKVGRGWLVYNWRQTSATYRQGNNIVITLAQKRNHFFLSYIYMLILFWFIQYKQQTRGIIEDFYIMSNKNAKSITFWNSNKETCVNHPNLRAKKAGTCLRNVDWQRGTNMCSSGSLLSTRVRAFHFSANSPILDANTRASQLENNGSN